MKATDPALALRTAIFALIVAAGWTPEQIREVVEAEIESSLADVEEAKS